MAPSDEQAKPHDDPGRTQRFDVGVGSGDAPPERTQSLPIDDVAPEGQNEAAPEPAPRESTARFDPILTPARESTTRYDQEEVQFPVPPPPERQSQDESHRQKTAVMPTQVPDAPIAPSTPLSPAKPQPPEDLGATIPGSLHANHPHINGPALGEAPTRGGTGPLAGPGVSSTGTQSTPVSRKPLRAPEHDGDSGVQLETSSPGMRGTRENSQSRPQGAAAGEIPTAQRPMVEELEKPYSLQPEELDMSDAASASKRRLLPRPVVAVLGLAIGLGISGLIYFRPSHVTFPALSLGVEKLALPPTFDDVAPPKHWTPLANQFFGIDEFNSPWLYDPVSGVTSKANGFMPPELAATGAVTIAGRPPLDAHTRLAWIEAGTGDVAHQLVCRDFDFITSVSAKLAAGPAPLNVTIALPAGDYPYAPSVADNPDPKIGLRLISIDAKGLAAGWAPQASEHNKPVWQIDAHAAPNHAPLMYLAMAPAVGKDTPAKATLVAMIFTARGLEVVDSATGQSVGKIEWTMQEGRGLGLTPLRAPGNLIAWAASDGAHGTAFTVAANGAPKKLYDFASDDITLAATKNASTTSSAVTASAGAKGDATKAYESAVRVISFPDATHPEADSLVVASRDGGRLAWFGATGAAAPKALAMIDKSTSNSLAAMDLSGDGFYDLVSLGGSGKLWAADGLLRVPVADLGPTAKAPFAPPASVVLWRMTNQALIGEYFDAAGVPQRLTLKLPATAGKHIGMLADDWKSRRHDD